MNQRIKYCVLGLLIILLSGCYNPLQKKTLWRITLDKKDKKPYGSYLAFESLKYLFPNSDIIPLSSSFRYTAIDEKMMDTRKGRSVFIALGLDFYISEPEIKKLISFAKQGNEVLILSRSLDDKLKKKFNCTIVNNGFEEIPLTRKYDGSVFKKCLSINDITGEQFGYQGRSILAYFKLKPVDSTSKKSEQNKAENLIVNISDTLGFSNEHPNFIRYNVGEGHIMLHSAPLVMSNYFLLQPRNRFYFEKIWSQLPDNISRIYWNNYFKRNITTSDLGVLLKYPATRWAFIIAVISLIMYVLFEGKRKQKIIPVITPLENSSVSFVETVGRLYFNKGNHTNLGEKMVQHFLEWVRANYFISTSQPDEQFAKQLMIKSGLPENVVKSLVEMIREIQSERKQLDEADLYHLHHTIQRFYQTAKTLK